MGSTYTFQVQARNAFGYGTMSNAGSILAATVPSTPAAPTTSFAPDAITVSWVAPATNGAAITSYIITIRESNGATYITDSTNCNGSSSTIVSATSCTIPVSTLIASPYSLPYGSSIFAKITAINI
jgi:hypothetical protein